MRKWSHSRVLSCSVYPGGTQLFLSGTKLKSPPGKTEQPAHDEVHALKGQTDKKSGDRQEKMFTTK